MARNPNFKSISVKMDVYESLEALVGPGGKVATTLAWLVRQEHARRREPAA